MSEFSPFHSLRINWLPRLIALGVVFTTWRQGTRLLVADDWPQFRGPSGAAVAAPGSKYPAAIGPNAGALWKAELPPGHSSPVVVGKLVFVTAARDNDLTTIALDRATGRVLWERNARHESLESIHGIGSHAQSTPCADGSFVVSFFGSAGLHCYTHAGELVWRKPMGPFKNSFGAASSPVMHRGRVVLCQDHDQGSFLAAYDATTGDEMWRVDRSEFPRNFSTPVIWEQPEGRTDVVIAATLRIVGYDVESGRERWTVRGISRMVCSSPALGANGQLYVAAWSAGGDEGDQFVVEPFEQAVAARDADGDGRFSEAELPDGPLKQRFEQADRDKDQHLTRKEYEYFRSLFEQGRNVTLAVRPGPQGEATDSHVAWKYPKQTPFCASPVAAGGFLFGVKDGGVLTALTADAGRVVKQFRLPHTGDYYASPVAADGKVYLADEEGRLTVVSADAECRVLHTAEFGESIFATPAFVDGQILLRTRTALYCFGDATGN